MASLDELHSRSLGTPTLKSTQASFSYLKNSTRYDTEKPYHFAGPLDPDQEHLRTNLEYEQVNAISIYNLRGIEEYLDLSRHGFKFWRHKSSIDLQTWAEDTLQQYLKEITELVKHVLKPEIVFCYDYRFRKNQSQQPPFNDTSDTRLGSLGKPDEPTNIPHVDQTREGGYRRVRRHLTVDEGQKYLGGGYRIRIINTWRPLRMVDDAPLAFCDFFPVNDSLLVAADRVAPEYCGEVYYLLPDSGQKWYFLENQSPNELAVFMSFDSHPGGGAPYCPHSSFQAVDISGAPGWPRESVETRMIVISRLPE